MKIAFVSANQEKLPDACIPLGLLYVMAATPERHEKVLWDLCFRDDPHVYLRERLAEFSPDLIAFGMRNIQNNDYSGIDTNLTFYCALMHTLRAHSDAPIVVGGGGFSVMPKELMRELRPDYGIWGEGEEHFPRLLEALEAGAEVPPGVYAWSDGELAHRPYEGGFLDMNGLKEPDRSLVDRRYYEEYGIDSVQTKRGCALKCDYCTYPLIEGVSGRTREPARIADEFGRLSAFGARHVFIVDSVFNLPIRHAKAVCRELIARGNTMPWTSYANPIAYDDELAGLMAESGCVGMEIGSDSGCEDILLRLKKGFTVKQIVSMNERSVRFGLKDCHTFILGTQGETMDHVHQTLDFVVDLDPFSAIIMVWIDDYEALDPVYAAERRALRDTIFSLLEERKDQFAHWIIPPMDVNFDEETFRFMRKAGMHGPLWQHIRTAIAPSGRQAGRRRDAARGTASPGRTGEAGSTQSAAG